MYNAADRRRRRRRRRESGVRRGRVIALDIERRQRRQRRVQLSVRGRVAPTSAYVHTTHARTLGRSVGRSLARESQQWHTRAGPRGE